MIERGRRLLDLRGPEALAAAALGAVAAGVAVVGERLVDAAQAHRQAAAMEWPDRLLLGLWTFRLEAALVFTLGAALLALAASRGARLEGWIGPAARLVGGLCVGLALVAAVLAVGSTVVALAGSLGPDGSQIGFSGRERLFTWLRQVVTAAGAAVVWSLLAARLAGVADAPAAEAARVPAADEDEEPEPPGPPLPPPEPLPTHAFRPPAATAPAPPIAPPAPAPDPAPAPAPAPAASAARRAETLWRQSLAFSPRRDEARRIVDEVGRLERDGRDAEAAALIARLESF